MLVRNKRLLLAMTQCTAAFLCTDVPGLQKSEATAKIIYLKLDPLEYIPGLRGWGAHVGRKAGGKNTIHLIWFEADTYHM